MLSCVIFICTMIVTLVVFEETSEVEKDVQEIDLPIVSLDRSTSINGSFYIGIGYINSTRKYVVMRKLGENRYKEESFSQNAIIVEDATPDESYVTVNRCVSEEHTGFSIVRGKYTTVKEDCSLTWQEQEWAELHIPKGTVAKEYSVK